VPGLGHRSTPRPNENRTQRESDVHRDQEEIDEPFHGPFAGDETEHGRVEVVNVLACAQRHGDGCDDYIGSLEELALLAPLSDLGSRLDTYPCRYQDVVIVPQRPRSLELAVHQKADGDAREYLNEPACRQDSWAVAVLIDGLGAIRWGIGLQD
jgi:hypothetical protein